jgi:hypothetical protein
VRRLEARWASIVAGWEPAAAVVRLIAAAVVEARLIRVAVAAAAAVAAPRTLCRAARRMMMGTIGALRDRADAALVAEAANAILTLPEAILEASTRTGLTGGKLLALRAAALSILAAEFDIVAPDMALPIRVLDVSKVDVPRVMDGFEQMCHQLLAAYRRAGDWPTAVEDWTLYHRRVTAAAATADETNEFVERAVGYLDFFREMLAGLPAEAVH